MNTPIRRALLAVLFCFAFSSLASAQDDAEGEAPSTEEPEADATDPEAAEGDAESTEDEPAAEEESEPEPEPEPPPPPVEVAPEPPVQSSMADAPTCGATAHEAAAQAVVRVRSGNEWAAGFAYHSSRHVVTAWSVINRGQGTTVYTRDGTRYETLLLARDEQLDLAVLEVREEMAGVTPLQPAPETSAMLGREVIAIGHPFFGATRLLGERGEGLLRWSIAQGRVGAVNEQGIQADVALTADHTGGPLVDCQGRVLGMITGAGLLSADLGLVARIARADSLIAEAGEAGEFLGNFRLSMGLGAGLVIDEQGRAAGGFYLTLGAILFDRISWMNRVGLFTGGIDDPLGDVLEHSRDIVRVETMLGYRFFVDLFGLTTMYIVPAGGVMVMNQRGSQRTANVVCTDPTMADTCSVDVVEERDYATIAGATPNAGFQSDQEWVVRPTVGLSFILGGTFEIGYTLEIGLETSEVETYHVIRAGFAM